MVKCEIVVPIFVKKKLAAELDVESYFVNTFTRSEQEFVEACAAVVGKIFRRALTDKLLGSSVFGQNPESGL
jgi:putative methionine-R-sulfoxide reductase with GAF domain